MSYYLEYVLRLEEPCKMGTQGNQNNTSALSYLAGSSLRGAFITQYLKKYKDVDKQDLFRHTYFYDAYICQDDQKLIPVPSIYYASKHEMRKVKLGEKDALEVKSCYDPDLRPEEGQQRVDTSAFASFEGDTYHPYQVKKQGQLHINIEDDGMFRYEAISPDQYFNGVIVCENEATCHHMQDLLKDEIFYIGGSKGSGYGRVHIESTKISSFEDYLSSYRLKKHQNQNYFTLYALSNILFIDQYGDLKATVDPSYLEKHLGISHVKLIKAYSSTMRTASFNHTWKAGNVQQTAIKAGSYFLYSYEGNMDDSYKVLEEKGIGQRKTEGFGRVLFNVDFSQTKRLPLQLKAHTFGKIEVSKEDRKFLSNLQQSINNKRMEDLIDEAAYRCYKNSKDPLSNTQLARLYNLLDSILIGISSADEAERDLKFNEGKLRINSFKEGLKTKSKDAYRIKKLQMDNGTIKRYIEMLEELFDDNVSYNLYDTKFKELYTQLKITNEGKKNYEKSYIKLLFLHKVLYNQMRGGSGHEN